MRPLPIAILSALFASCATGHRAPEAATAPGATTSSARTAAPPPAFKWGLAIHGGAGKMAPSKLSPEQQVPYRAELEKALKLGHHILANGGSSVDAVAAAITVLEDSPLFNAGKGAVFNHDGKNEMDAAIMDGATQRAGAVAAVHRVKNPILLARKVMEASPHVMLVGDGAEQFAQSQGITLVDPSYFFTPERWDQLQRARAAEQQSPAHSERDGASEGLIRGEWKFGTVGVVALDQQGHLAAGTSTGGMTNKRFGRVGDSPIIGAGTYASSDCAVSATGHGEYFIRYTVAHDICARLRYQRVPLEQAANAVIDGELVRAGGEGGVVALDSEGHLAMVFNSDTMYRGSIGPDGNPVTAVLREPAR